MSIVEYSEFCTIGDNNLVLRSFWSPLKEELKVANSKYVIPSDIDKKNVENLFRWIYSGGKTGSLLKEKKLTNEYLKLYKDVLDPIIFRKEVKQWILSNLDKLDDEWIYDNLPCFYYFKTRSFCAPKIRIKRDYIQLPFILDTDVHTIETDKYIVTYSRTCDVDCEDILCCSSFIYYYYYHALNIEVKIKGNKGDKGDKGCEDKGDKDKENKGCKDKEDYFYLSLVDNVFTEDIPKETEDKLNIWLKEQLDTNHKEYDRKRLDFLGDSDLPEYNREILYPGLSCTARYGINQKSTLLIEDNGPRKKNISEEEGVSFFLENLDSVVYN